MMNVTLAQLFSLWIRRSMPMALVAMLAVISVFSIKIPGWASVVPDYTSMAIFYWAVFRPDLQPVLLLFMIGLLKDIITGNPLGLTAISLLLLHGLALSQQRFLVTKPFLFICFAFMLIQLPISILSWLMMSVLHFCLIAPDPVMYQYLITVFSFPIMMWFLFHLHCYVIR
ncbi:rod shape-determining protein MreD [Candidatus Endolissoclinum faulkneri L2]|uniref:Rod shape-determining protein MreD n=1 Tax=Candidatus Endolissoclinum faulkneri L2 TaxID=1193729 RepID=K7YIR1_9PROT|nr:rod shape-determining protein MreD [Candidatus Endolissoclinum faulkneri]AFX99490.1 rod shape-determining protein MreD [Candidatus Endolissoclinum faulkneri L2]